MKKKKQKLRYYETEYGTPVVVEGRDWVPCTWKPITKEEFEERAVSHRQCLPDDDL